MRRRIRRGCSISGGDKGDEEIDKSNKCSAKDLFILPIAFLSVVTYTKCKVKIYISPMLCSRTSLNFDRMC